MESPAKKTTVFEFFDKQTFSERKEFNRKMQELGFKRQRVYNWINKITPVAEDAKPIINKLAGQELDYPKLKIIRQVETV